MAREAVNLVKSKVKRRGKVYLYWTLRWYSSDGKYRSKNIGKVDSLSQKQAERIRIEKVVELTQHPSRRNVGKSMRLADYLQTYFKNRACELAPATVTMQRMTGRYLLEFFGKGRRLNQIPKIEARMFKAALSEGKLNHVSKRIKKIVSASTVDIHIRNSRTFFNFALDDEQVLFNPFTRLSKVVKSPKDWADIGQEKFQKLMGAAPANMKLLLALCRLAGLRRGEALSLEWGNIDFDEHTITIIAKADWQPKDKEPRTVPISSELQAALRPSGVSIKLTGKVIEGINIRNIWRSFQALCRRAKVESYSKPFHTLRKNCITDWARRYPAHVVMEWAGHSSFDTTNQHYLKVSKSEYKDAANTALFEQPDVTEKVTEKPDSKEKQAS